MTRRTAIAVLAAAIHARADSASDCWDVIAAMAAALAEDNAPGFLKRVDPKMAGYDDLAANIQGMIDQADVHSTISPLSNEGNDSARTLQLDWQLQLTRKGDETRTTSREEAVTVQMRRDGKAWRVSKLDPLPFFAPPNFG